METKKYTWKQLVMVASLIFGMFFGAGNLIFPVHLGQLAGGHWLQAGLGFAVSGGLFPLLAILAVVVTKSDGLYELALPVGKWFAAAFLVLVHLTIGPFFGTPRTAATAFEMAAKPFLADKYTGVGMFVFSALFFGAAYFLTVHPHRLVKYIGKYLNTVFLVLLAVIFAVALLHPMGGLTHQATAAYRNLSLSNGFLEGYNTVDAVALLALSVTFVHSIRGMGFKDKEIAKMTALSGSMSIAFEVVIYLGLILLGAASLNKFAVSANGGEALSQIVTYYLGSLGTAFLGVLVTLGVFTTAMGLVVSFAQDFHKLFPKVSYKTWLRGTTFVSFVVANAGLTNIIAWSLPVLMLLYPLSLALILLSLTHKLFPNNHVVYKMTMGFTLVPAVLDMLNSSPAVVSQQPAVASLLQFYHHYVPLAQLGLGWVVPTLLGYLLGLVLYHMQTGTVLEQGVTEVHD